MHSVSLHLAVLGWRSGSALVELGTAHWFFTVVWLTLDVAKLEAATYIDTPDLRFPSLLM
jgi:hypothetical protein